MSRQILTLDSSQIETFLNCDYEWLYSYNQNLTLNNEIREDMAMGSYGHKMLEVYYQHKALGHSLTECAEIALNEVNLEGFPLTKPSILKVREAFNRYVTYYAVNDVTVLMGKPSKEIKWNDQNNFNEEWKLNPLVEKGFSYPLLDTPDYLFVLEGRIDLLCNQGGQEAFLDHKFQSRENRLYKKSIQFRNYAMVTGVRLGIINYIRFHKNIEPKTLERVHISFSQFELEWWKRELISVFIEISHKMKTGEYRRRWNSCKGKYGYPCSFTPICEERNEAVRENIKTQLYRIKEKWSPW